MHFFLTIKVFTNLILFLRMSKNIDKIIATTNSSVNVSESIKKAFDDVKGMPKFHQILIGGLNNFDG
jgi:hypothetical protein